MAAIELLRYRGKTKGKRERKVPLIDLTTAPQVKSGWLANSPYQN